MWLSPALLLLSLTSCFSIHGPESVRGPEQGSVTVHCHYKPRWKTNSKWWCRGAYWKTCRILIQTSGSEQEEKSGRVSIRDNQRDHSFKVTMERLRQDDTDTYWCGIEKIGTDLGIRIKVTVDPVGTDTTSYKPHARTNVDSNMEVSFGSYKRTHYILLVFVKVPILLILAGAVLWLKGISEGPQGATEIASCRNLNPEFLTKDIAP
ncbi:CMRF35-like molecule 7 [Castor canadensis]|uniref:CMRF35-like molecule 7 n=1 Tax=Castor canadensis TaxID=51338 RepID=A0A250YC29_CASCN|nr:CMRF35-like molecule 7 [Castor canadensis]